MGFHKSVLACLMQYSEICCYLISFFHFLRAILDKHTTDLTQLEKKYMPNDRIYQEVARVYKEVARVYQKVARVYQEVARVYQKVVRVYQ